jgi:predicted hydrolase (HD superfamily)
MSLQLGRQQFGNPNNTGNVLSKEEAYQLLNEWVLNERLKLHMVQVGGLMKAWAEEMEHLNPEQVWKWQMAGCMMQIGINGQINIVKKLLNTWKKKMFVRKFYGQLLHMVMSILG